MVTCREIQFSSAQDYLDQIQSVDPETLPSRIENIFKRYDNQDIDRILRIENIFSSDHGLILATENLCRFLGFDEPEAVFYGDAMTTRALINKIAESFEAMNIIRKSKHAKSLVPESLNSWLLKSLKFRLDWMLPTESERLYLQDVYRRGLVVGSRLGEYIRFQTFDLVTLTPEDLVSFMSADLEAIREKQPLLVTRRKDRYPSAFGLVSAREGLS